MYKQLVPSSKINRQGHRVAVLCVRAGIEVAVRIQHVAITFMYVYFRSKWLRYSVCVQIQIQSLF